MVNQARTRKLYAATATGGITAAGTALIWLALVSGGAGGASADALCDAMRDQYGPNWPCISVPPPPSQELPTADPTTPGGQAGGGGVEAGADTGPGPGEGNGTPIAPVPGQEDPGSKRGQSARTQAPATVPAPLNTSTRPQSTAATGDASAPKPEAAQPHSATTAQDNALLPSLTDSSDGKERERLVQGGLIVAAVAGFLVGGTYTRSGTRIASVGRGGSVAAGNVPNLFMLAGGDNGSILGGLLPAGGSERATVGPTQLVLINDRNSSKDYVFDVDVPPGGHITVNPDGSATVYDVNGRAVKQIAKPWAYDSLGRPQRTWYTVDENGNLVQHVDTADDALYPILADPTTSTVNPDGSVTTVTTNDAGQVITTATSVPVPDSGGSVDTTVQNADGTTSQARSVPDGQGGVTTWTANPDGSHTVLYPDGTFYEEPAPGSGKGYTQGSTDGNTVNTTYTDPSGNQYNSTSTPDVNGSVHTEMDTPQGHVSSQSDPAGKGEIVTTATTPEGKTVMTRTKPDGDGGSQSIRLTEKITNPDGTSQYVQEDGKLFNPDAGKGLTSETTIKPDGSSSTQYSDGSQLILREDGTGTAIDAKGNKTEFLPSVDPETGKAILIDPSTGKPVDLSDTLSNGSTAIGTVGSAIERGGKALPTGSHHAGPSLVLSSVNSTRRP